MSDPRNVAHNKKVAQEKEHQAPNSPSGAAGKSKKKAKKGNADENAQALRESEPTAAAKPEIAPGELEKSVAVLSKLKEMEFYSKANIETLAGLLLTVEDELKQPEFAEPLGAVYSAQNNFQSAVAALVESYEAKCDSLKLPA